MNAVEDPKALMERARKSGLISFGRESSAPPVALAGKAAGKLPSATGGSPVPPMNPMPVMEWTFVTPEMAAWWLAKNNLENRALRASTSDAFARDMLAGNWLLTHQGIAFNDKAVLIDGQTRLDGIVKSGVGIWLAVWRGFQAKTPAGKRTMDAIDTGVPRSLADHLVLQHGFEKKTVRACIAAGTVVATLCFGEKRGNKIRKMTVQQILSVLKECGPSVKFAIENRSEINGLKQANVIGAVALVHLVDPEVAGKFCGKLMKGENLSATDPVLALRNFLLSKAGEKHATMGRVGVAELVLTVAWTLMAGTVLTDLTINPAALEWFKAKLKGPMGRIASIFEISHAGTMAGIAALYEKAAHTGQKDSIEVRPPNPAPAPAAAPARPTLERIIQAAEKQFGTGKAILLNRRANDEIVVSCRNCMLRAMEELGHGKAAIAAATGFDINDLTRWLAAFAQDLKVNVRLTRKYAAFRAKFEIPPKSSV
jgi:hypothetical protein